MGDDKGKLYVGKLDYGATDDDLYELFEKYGRVTDVQIVKDRETGRPRGFAFVTYENERDATDALSAIQNESINGREITVQQSLPRSSRGGGGGGSYGGRGGSYGGRGGSYGGRGGSYGGRGGSYGSRDYGSGGGSSYGGGGRSYGGGGGYGGDRSYGGGGGSRSYSGGGGGGY